MRKYGLGIFGFFLVLLLIFLFFKACEEPKPIEIIKHDTIHKLSERIVTHEKEVVKWKEQKTKIIYRTKFDTLATIDTVYLELVKCDSIIKIDSNIIANQDTIIARQMDIIDIQDQELEEKTKEIKKQKHKLFLTKIVGVISIITVLLLVK